MKARRSGVWVVARRRWRSPILPAYPGVMDYLQLIWKSTFVYALFDNVSPSFSMYAAYYKMSTPSLQWVYFITLNILIAGTMTLMYEIASTAI